jgi:predicted secreted protein
VSLTYFFKSVYLLKLEGLLLLLLLLPFVGFPPIHSQLLSVSGGCLPHRNQKTCHYHYYVYWWHFLLKIEFIGLRPFFPVTKYIPGYMMHQGSASAPVGTKYVRVCMYYLCVNNVTCVYYRHLSPYVIISINIESFLLLYNKWGIVPVEDKPI